MSKYDKDKLVELEKKSNDLQCELEDVNKELTDLSGAKVEGNDWTPEMDMKYDLAQDNHARICREMGVINPQIDAMYMNAPKEDMPEVEADPQEEALNAFMLGQSGVDKVALSLNFKSSMEKARMIKTGDSAAGLKTIRTDLADDVIDSLDAFGQAATIPSRVVTPDGAEMLYITADNTAQIASAISSQGTAQTEQDMNDFDNQSLKVKSKGTGWFELPREWLDDSNFNLAEYANRNLRRRASKLISQQVIKGNTNEFVGIEGKAKVEALSSSTGFVPVDESVDLEFAVNRAYMDGEGPMPGALPTASGLPQRNGFRGFIMSRQMEKLLRKARDADGRPLWTGSMVAGFGNTLLGHEIRVIDEMDDVTTGKFPIAFGAFDYFILRTVGEVEISNFYDSELAKKNTRMWIGHMRIGMQSLLKDDSNSKNEAVVVGRMA